MVYRKTTKVKKRLDGREQAIVEAARQILADKSYHGVSIQAIAKKAGIAVGTFYLYFRNKEALFKVITTEMYAELLAVIKAEREQYTNVLDKLKASMQACVKLFLQERNLAKILLVQLPFSNNVFNNILTELEDELVKLTKQDLDEAVAAGLLPQQDTYVSAVAFVGTFRQVITSWLREGEPKDLPAAFRYLEDYNLRGLGASLSK